MKKISTYAAVITADVLWGFSFIWTNQLIAAGTPIFTFIFFRMLIAGVGLLAFSLLIGKMQRIKKGDLKYFLLMVFFEPFLYFVGETFGIKGTASPTLSAVIIAIIPVVVLIADRFIYREPLRRSAMIGISFVLIGIVVMMYQKGGLRPATGYGVLLLLLAVLASSGYVVVVKKLQGNYNALTITCWQFLIGSVFFMPFFLIFESGRFNPSEFFTADVLKPLLYLAILCSCLAFVLYVTSIKHIGITRASVFTACIPVVSALGAAAMGQENLNLQKILGMFVVIAGVIISQLHKGKTLSRKA